MKIGPWQKASWPFDEETAKQTACWFLPIGSGTPNYFGKKISSGIYLRSRKYFNFCCSFGPNNDRSYSGCCYGHDEIKTLDDAKKYIQKVVVPKVT